MADIIYAIRPAYCLFSLTRCLQPKQPSTDGERQAQLLDDDTSPLGLALSAGVHPFFISVHGSMIALSGLSSPSCRRFCWIHYWDSKQASHPASRCRACPVAEASLLPRRPPGPATTSDELSFRSWCVQHVRLSVSAAV